MKSEKEVLDEIKAKLNVIPGYQSMPKPFKEMFEKLITGTFKLGMLHAINDIQAYNSALVMEKERLASEINKKWK